MSQLKFYRDVEDDFSCQIKIEGASLASSKARLVLELSDGRSLLFNGKIDGDGKVSIPLNLRGVVESVGVATLEIIAESMYFAPYTSDFSIETKKKVTVESVQTSVSSEKKITVEVVAKTPVKEVVAIKKNSTSIFKEDASDLAFVKRHLVEYDPKYDFQLDSYKAHPKILEWAKRNFVNISDPKVKFCMYLKENRSRKS
jgi:hypothetical protein